VITRQRSHTTRIIPRWLSFLIWNKWTVSFRTIFFSVAGNETLTATRNVSEKQRGVIFYSGVMVTIYTVIIETQQNDPNWIVGPFLCLREKRRDIIHERVQYFLILLYLHLVNHGFCWQNFLHRC
jgi:hypothetical protein